MLQIQLHTSEEVEAFLIEEHEAIKFMLDTKASTCEICYSETLGSDNFVVFTNCLHYFCKKCLQDYAKNVILRGDLQRLICPNFSGCNTYLSET